MQFTRIKNDLGKYTLTGNEIEEVIKNYTLKFSFDGNRSRDPEVEYLKIPSMRDRFYKFVNNNDKIPTQDEFYNSYIFDLFNSTKRDSSAITAISFLDKYNDCPYKMDCFRLRIFRSHPSFVREVHLYSKLKDSKEFKRVLVNTKLDHKHDVDIGLVYRGCQFGVVLFVDTETSNGWRATKSSSRHNRLEDVVYIELPLSMKKANNCGPFKLYTDDDVNYIIDECKKGLT